MGKIDLYTHTLTLSLTRTHTHSGLSISAAMGVRDSNEASYTQVMEVLEFMSDNTRCVCVNI
jgi:2-methylisocitrate lyase-like PEP mutase family enzyme